MFWIVTVKLSKSPNHDPHNKLTGSCPLDKVFGDGATTCSDLTGEHHSFLVMGGTIQEARKHGVEVVEHITRIEGPFNL